MSTLRRSSAALSIVLAALAASALPVSAAVVVSHSGSHGHYEVTDSATAAGARCTYETASYDLDRISVRGPKVWSRASDVDGQLVGWQFLIQRSPVAGGAWTTAHTSKVFEQFANHGTPVKFKRRAWTAPETQDSRWRVQIVINWYHFSENGPPPLDGTVTLRLQHYNETWNGHSFGNQPRCVGHF
jgi:hypothetical protein